MLRFSWNRWWVFVLTLCLFTTGFSLLGSTSPPVVMADSRLLPDKDQPWPGPTVGDPDVPIGPGTGVTGTITVRSTAKRAVVSGEIRRAGDVTTSDSVMAEHLRLLLLSLRSLLLRF